MPAGLSEPAALLCFSLLGKLHSFGPVTGLFKLMPDFGLQEAGAPSSHKPNASATEVSALVQLLTIPTIPLNIFLKLTFSEQVLALAITALRKKGTVQGVLVSPPLALRHRPLRSDRNRSGFHNHQRGGS